MPTNPPADEVDRIVDEWARARPDLDTAPLAVFSRISRLARHLESARRAAFTASGLEGWEFDVLSALRRDGEQSASPSALMHQTLVTSGTMTTRIDKLVTRGLVRRSPDPQDRRSVLITLEPAGVDLVDAAMERLLDAERTLLSSLPAADRTDLAMRLRDLLLPFEPSAG
ncbi:MarR family winged helix-turn-helix transcriptional regulator [Brachybacterium phenoliresistens]|uniref:MarR family transcriptional regulator n=1 Tax=Brachybacterium phenoliresistens TaxID=396014 RepID=Z9JQT0_9MICO|nr:MarR family winged helix-turn-helix transcriptional regulator [Brachybacterium phenoliresistens]EWS80514.1 MarR family transcriptional regulator [Brachybacterium phenoliresistens]